MKKSLLTIFALLLAVSLIGCQKNEPADEDGNVYHIGICNYVDHASLNQIVDNITSQLNALARGRDFRFLPLFKNILLSD